MTRRSIGRFVAICAVGGIPLVTTATCDPATGFFDFYRDDDADDFSDYFDDDFYDDCGWFDCF